MNWHWRTLNRLAVGGERNHEVEWNEWNEWNDDARLPVKAQSHEYARI